MIAFDANLLSDFHFNGHCIFFGFGVICSDSDLHHFAEIERSLWQVNCDMSDLRLFQTQQPKFHDFVSLHCERCRNCNWIVFSYDDLAPAVVVGNYLAEGIQLNQSLIIQRYELCLNLVLKHCKLNVHFLRCGEETSRLTERHLEVKVELELSQFALVSRVSEISQCEINPRDNLIIPVPLRVLPANVD